MCPSLKKMTLVLDLLSVYVFVACEFRVEADSILYFGMCVHVTLNMRLLHLIRK